MTADQFDTLAGKVVALSAEESSDSQIPSPQEAAELAAVLFASERTTPTQAKALANVIDEPRYEEGRDFFSDGEKRSKRNVRTDLMAFALSVMASAETPAGAFQPLLEKLSRRNRKRDRMNPFKSPRYKPVRISTETLAKMPASVQLALKPAMSHGAM